MSLDLIVKILDMLHKAVSIFASLKTLLGSGKQKRTRKDKKNHRR
ncbi:hypothetical protein [Paenibacillus larvae]|nr:hypothetical protein [Paenibacillus larvae]MDR5608793.1 hypothetical protein [Paenibacillus larvae]